MEVIERFEGEFEFLSNFAAWNGTTAEHIFQAEKTLSIEWRARILSALTPGKAKRLGRKAPLRPDWEQIKLRVMATIVREKFSQEPFRSQLLATGEALLVEGNHWGDTFWGICRGEGENWLGRILMWVREELQRG